MTIDIALDMLDLQGLKRAVSRAYDKDKTLRDFVRGSNTTLVLPFDHDESDD